jgi:hypothetical protein
MRKAREEEMSSFSGFLISFNLFNIFEWGVGGGLRPIPTFHLNMIER